MTDGSGERGRKPVGAERMLRMYFLQPWFNLSDEGVEDAVCGPRATSEFMGEGFTTWSPRPRGGAEARA